VQKTTPTPTLPHGGGWQKAGRGETIKVGTLSLYPPYIATLLQFKN